MPQSLERFLLFLTTLELLEGFRGSGSGLREQFKHGLAYSTTQ